MEEKGPTAPTDSQVPVMEASQGGTGVKAEESTCKVGRQMDNSHPGGTLRMNQIILRKAPSDGGGCDYKGN